MTTSVREVKKKRECGGNSFQENKKKRVLGKEDTAIRYYYFFGEFLGRRKGGCKNAKNGDTPWDEHA